MVSINNIELLNLLDNLLPSINITAKEKGINGLQIEGCEEINHIICGTSLSQKLIDKTIDLDAQAIIVHHGWVLSGKTPIGNIYRKRLKALLSNDINVYGYHIPLDVSRTLGHNVHIANMLKVDSAEFVSLGGIQDLGIIAHYTNGIEISTLQENLRIALGDNTTVNVLHEHTDKAYKICISAGSGQKFIREVGDYECDTYITGEASEQSLYFAEEFGLNYLYAGHYQTETVGMKYLARGLNKMGYKTTFIDLPNPV